MSNESNSEFHLLTTSEAAHHLRLSPRTLERWRAEGIGPKFIKMGPRAVLYTPAELASFLACSEFQTTAEASPTSRRLKNEKASGGTPRRKVRAR